jgi:phosphoribosylaminoimidazolecarboxamide formyltransferase/IMP cyclohydrolase
MGIAEKIDKMFMEVIIAPDYEEEALNVLKKKKNIRIVKIDVSKRAEVKSIRAMDIRKVTGGLLVQDMDTMNVTAENLTVKTKLRPTEKQLKDLLFAWKIVKFVKSNAIVVAKDGITIGIGPGQTNRVGSVDIALKNAGEKAKDAVLASDAYFPFRDNVDAAAAAGIKAIIQPGGSIRDEESIKAADEHGIAMVFTGVRHFKH